MRHDPLWTIKDVAKYLAIPVQTLYDWRWQHRGPKCFKLGGHLRYRESDVMEWLDQHTAVA